MIIVSLVLLSPVPKSQHPSRDYSTVQIRHRSSGRVPALVVLVQTTAVGVAILDIVTGTAVRAASLGIVTCVCSRSRCAFEGVRSRSRFINTCSVHLRRALLLLTERVAPLALKLTQCLNKDTCDQIVRNNIGKYNFADNRENTYHCTMLLLLVALLWTLLLLIAFWWTLLLLLLIARRRWWLVVAAVAECGVTHPNHGVVAFKHIHRPHRHSTVESNHMLVREARGVLLTKLLTMTERRPPRAVVFLLVFFATGAVTAFLFGAAVRLVRQWVSSDSVAVAWRPSAASMRQSMVKMQIDQRLFCEKISRFESRIVGWALIRR